MSYGKILGLLLLVGAGQVFSLDHVRLPSLVTHDGDGNFRLDANFKHHHQALVDCLDFIYMRDLARGLEHLDRIQEPAYVNFGKGVGVYDLPAFLQEADQLSVVRRAGLVARGYQLQELPGFTGINLSIQDRSTLFAYDAATNTLIIALCGMDEPSDKENVNDADLMAYDSVNKNNGLVDYFDTDAALHVQVHEGLLLRSAREFDAITLPAFKALWATLDVNARRNLSIIFVGHSLGGGRASFQATFLGEVLVTPEFYGGHFVGSNMIKVYLLCALRAGNAQFAEYVHALLGRDNIMHQAPALDKATAAQPGPGGYDGNGFWEALKRYHNAACPTLGWYAYDRASAVWCRNYQERRDRWLERREKKSIFHASEWSEIFWDRHYSLVAGPMHYNGSQYEFYHGSFEPMVIGGYGNPDFIETHLLPQGYVMQNTHLGRAGLYMKRWATLVGAAVGLL